MKDDTMDDDPMNDDPMAEANPFKPRPNLDEHGNLNPLGAKLD